MDLRLCFFGDSFTAGVGDREARGWVGRVVERARAGGQDVTGYNLGVRRETIPQIAARLLREAEPRLAEGDAQGVVFSGGVNDATVQGASRRVEVAQSLDALGSVDQICARRGWRLLVVGPAPVADPAQSERILALSAALAGACDAQGTAFVPVAPVLAHEAAWRAEVRSLDGAHPTGIGYERLTDLVWPTFDRWSTGLSHCGQAAVRERPSCSPADAGRVRPPATDP